MQARLLHDALILHVCIRNPIPSLCQCHHRFPRAPRCTKNDESTGLPPSRPAQGQWGSVNGGMGCMMCFLSRLWVASTVVPQCFLFITINLSSNLLFTFGRLDRNRSKLILWGTTVGSRDRIWRKLIWKMHISATVLGGPLCPGRRESLPRIIRPQSSGGEFATACFNDSIVASFTVLDKVHKDLSDRLERSA